jgi:hypothetical protein
MAIREGTRLQKYDSPAHPWLQLCTEYAIYVHFAPKINLRRLVPNIRPLSPCWANHVHSVCALNLNSPPKNSMHLLLALASALTRLDWPVILRGDYSATNNISTSFGLSYSSTHHGVSDTSFPSPAFSFSSPGAV